MADPIDYFRKALKMFALDKPKEERQAFKQEIVKHCGITIAYLNDLALGRRVGKEEIRYNIAKFLGYDDYSDFLALGEELFNGATFQEAKANVKKKQLLHPEPDGSIEKILSLWPLMTEEQKVALRQSQRLMIFNNSKEGKKIENFKKNSRERFQYLWDSVLEKKAPQTTLGWGGADLLVSYLAGNTTDVEVLEYADELNSVFS